IPFGVKTITPLPITHAETSPRGNKLDTGAHRDIHTCTLHTHTHTHTTHTRNTLLTDACYSLHTHTTHTHTHTHTHTLHTHATTPYSLTEKLCRHKLSPVHNRPFRLNSQFPRLTPSASLPSQSLCVCVCVCVCVRVCVCVCVCVCVTLSHTIYTYIAMVYVS